MDLHIKQQQILQTRTHTHPNMKIHLQRENSKQVKNSPSLWHQ